MAQLPQGIDQLIRTLQLGKDAADDARGAGDLPPLQPLRDPLADLRVARDAELRGRDAHAVRQVAVQIERDEGARQHHAAAAGRELRCRLRARPK